MVLLFARVRIWRQGGSSDLGDPRVIALLLFTTINEHSSENQSCFNLKKGLSTNVAVELGRVEGLGVDEAEVGQGELHHRRHVIQRGFLAQHSVRIL